MLSLRVPFIRLSVMNVGTVHVLCFVVENLKQDDVGEPILDVILEAGDLLYFPRGTIHQVLTLVLQGP